MPYEETEISAPQQDRNDFAQRATKEKKSLKRPGPSVSGRRRNTHVRIHCIGPALLPRLRTIRTQPPERYRQHFLMQ